MNALNPTESRVVGVLIEKAHTTPAQYPLSLNALVTGCNQRSNRLPLTNLSEDDVLSAVDSLRGKSLVRQIMMSGSRVEKYKHTLRDALSVSTSELAVIAELLLRGPQTVGELRGRASRIHTMESLDVVTNVLEHLASREPPMVRSVAPAPGSRATRYAQLLCPDLHPLDAPDRVAAPAAAVAPVPRTDDVADRLGRLEDEVRELRRLVDEIRPQAGSASRI